MKKSLLILILLSIVLFCGYELATWFSYRKTSTQQLQTMEIPSGWVAYSDLIDHISLIRPSVSRVLETQEELLATNGLSVCTPDHTKVCIYFPPTYFPGSNFISAEVAIHIIQELPDQGSCFKPYGNEKNGSQVSIGSKAFTKFFWNDNSSSQENSGYNYRSYLSNHCVEIATRITTSTLVASTSTAQFTPEIRSQLEATLSQIAESVRFSESQ